MTTEGTKFIVVITMKDIPQVIDAEGLKILQRALGTDDTLNMYESRREVLAASIIKGIQYSIAC